MYAEKTLQDWFIEAEEIVKVTASYKKYLKEKLESQK